MDYEGEDAFIKPVTEPSVDPRKITTTKRRRTIVDIPDDFDSDEDMIDDGGSEDDYVDEPIKPRKVREYNIDQRDNLRMF